MYYAIPRAGVIARAGQVLLSLLLLLCTAALAQEQPKRFLEVTSQGYSRYEISEGDVVAFFTGGIQCNYLGFTLSADEMRYNHATQVASANGKVSLTSAAVNFVCDSVVLDGSTGQLRVESAITGEITEAKIRFIAGSAIVHFPAGQITTDLQQLSIELAGAGATGIILTDSNNSELRTARLEYVGSSHTARAPGPFTLTAELRGAMLQANDSLGPPLEATHLNVTGTSMEGIIDESGMLSSARINDALLDTGEAKLEAVVLDLKITMAPGELDKGWNVEATGNPISGRTERDGQVVTFSAQRVNVIATAAEANQIELREHVSVTASSGVMTADLVRISIQGQGYAITAPDGLRVSFDLAALSGNTPIDLPDLSKYSKQEQE